MPSNSFEIFLSKSGRRGYGVSHDFFLCRIREEPTLLRLLIGSVSVNAAPSHTVPMFQKLFGRRVLRSGWLRL